MALRYTLKLNQRGRVRENHTQHVATPSCIQILLRVFTVVSMRCRDARYEQKWMPEDGMMIRLKPLSTDFLHSVTFCVLGAAAVW